MLRLSAYLRRQHAPTPNDRHSDVRRPTFMGVNLVWKVGGEFNCMRPDGGHNTLASPDPKSGGRVLCVPQIYAYANVQITVLATVFCSCAAGPFVEQAANSSTAM